MLEDGTFFADVKNHIIYIFATFEDVYRSAAHFNTQGAVVVRYLPSTK